MSEEEKRIRTKKVCEAFSTSFTILESHPVETGVSHESESPRDFEEAVETTGYGPFNYLLLLALLPAGWAGFFETIALSYVLPSAECDLQLTIFQKGILNAAIYAGMISSCFLWGFLADIKGRRSLLMIGYLADSICNILSSLSQNFYVTFAFKFLSGGIISGPLSISMTYLAEFHGAKYRTRALLWGRSLTSLANLVLPGLAWIIIPQPWSISLFNGAFVYNSWRIFILVCSIPALVAFLILFYLPESPKFLMSQGRNEEALKILERMYAMNTGKSPESFPVKTLCQEIQKKQLERSVSQRKPFIQEKIRNGFVQIKPLFHKPYVGQFFLITIIQLGSNLSLNTLRLWMPQLLTLIENFYSKNRNVNLGEPTLCEIISISNSSEIIINELNSTITNLCVVNPVPGRVYINSTIISLATVMGYAIAGYLINLIGKKVLLLSLFAIPAVCSFALNWSPNYAVTMVIFSIYIASMSTTVTTVISFIVDIIPTAQRATAVSLTMCLGRAGAMIGSLLFPVYLNVGCMGPFMFTGGFLLVCFLLSIFISKPPQS